MTDDSKQGYADIFELPPHRSPCRTPMPREERAAQFSSFAALPGHDRAILDQMEKHILAFEQYDQFEDVAD